MSDIQISNDSENDADQGTQASDRKRTSENPDVGQSDPVSNPPESASDPSDLPVKPEVEPDAAVTPQKEGTEKEDTEKEDTEKEDTEKENAEPGITESAVADAVIAAAADLDAKSDLEDLGDSQPPPSPHQIRRRRLYRLLLIAGILTVVFVITLYSSHGLFDQRERNVISEIAPGVLFEQVCAEARTGDAKILHIRDFVVSDDMIGHLRGIDSIETLIFDKGAVTDDALGVIAELPRLQHLRLRLSPISDRGLATLSKVDSLWYLNLPHAQCTARGVEQLAALPRLRQLRLGSPKLGNDVTHAIAKITTLRGVHLIGVPVTDEGLKTLASMPYLESLYLDDSAVTEAGWEWLFESRPHLHVHINQHHHDRDPQAHTHH